MENNNSYEFFKKTKDAVITGDTGSNVSDLIIAIKNKLISGGLTPQIKTKLTNIRRSDL